MRQKTTIEDKIYKYTLKGLNTKEIGKLLDLSDRTVQRYKKQSKCNPKTQPKTLHERALELHAAGFSYAEIAKKLRVCKSTVYNWHRKAKAGT
jgi:transposase